MKRHAWQLALVAFCALGILLASGAGRPVASKVRGGYHQAVAARHGDGDHKRIECSTIVTREEALKSVSVKTGVTDAGSTVSGVLSLKNQNWRSAGVEDHAYTHYLQIEAGRFTCVLLDVNHEYWSAGQYTDASPPAGTDAFNSLIFLRKLWDAGEGVEYAHDYIYLNDTTGWDVDVAYSITVTGARVRRARTSAASHGRDGAPVYASDTTATDEWETVRPASYAVTFGPLSESGTQTWSGSAWTPNADSITAATIALSQMEADAPSYPAEYARATVNWSAVALNFSGWSKLFGTDAFKVRGSGNALIYEALKGFDVQGSPYESSVGHARPTIVDFSQFAVWDRAQTLMGDVRISGGFTACKQVPGSLNCSTDP